MQMTCRPREERWQVSCALHPADGELNIEANVFSAGVRAPDNDGEILGPVFQSLVRSVVYRPKRAFANKALGAVQKQTCIAVSAIGRAALDSGFRYF